MISLSIGLRATEKHDFLDLGKLLTLCFHNNRMTRDYDAVETEA